MSDESEKKRTIPEASYETLALAERIGKLEPGEELTYEELTAVCGRDVRVLARGALASARRIAERDHGVVTECVYKVGIKRLDGSELVDSQAAGMKRIRNASRRYITRLGKTDWNKLSQEKKAKLNALLSTYGVVAHISKTNNVAMLESKMQASEAKPLPVGRTMELFQGK